jgi:hypothetical protein
MYIKKISFPYNLNCYIENKQENNPATQSIVAVPDYFNIFTPNQ